MDIKLSSNISKYRKEKGMTQEMLASALGVTFASVSKWERDVATPDISLILQMASLFGISLDTFIGYDISINSIETIVNRIEEYERNMQYDEAILEANKALGRYPNSFKLVYNAAGVYYIAGFKSRNHENIRKSIELLEKAIVLLQDNDDSTINESSIRGLIAGCYIDLGEIEKGIDILKKYNTMGVYSPKIAQAYTSKPGFDIKGVEKYISDGVSQTISNLVLIISSLCGYYKELKDYDKTIDTCLFLKNVLDNLKINETQNTYFDKIVAYIYANCAVIYELKNDEGKIREYLSKAYELAIKYDSNPVREISNLKLFINCEREHFEDSIGSTAKEAVERGINKSEKLKRIYDEIRGLNYEKNS